MLIFDHALASKSICLGSSQVIFHSSLSIQSYAQQLNLLTNRKTALGVYSVLGINT